MMLKIEQYESEFQMSETDIDQEDASSQQYSILKKNDNEFFSLGEDEDEINKIFKNNNIIKNILKQYYKYLINKTNQSLITEFIVNKPLPYSLKLIKKYFKDINYNNQSLIKIMKHEKYGKGFEYYLTFDAADELINSKVKNIEDHLISINFLKKCCVNHELLDNINFYKKKNKILE